MKYIDFNTRIDYKNKEQQTHNNYHHIDMNNKYTKRQIVALINGYGSATENIVICFVKSDINGFIRLGYDLYEARDRLNEFQKDLVLKLRVMLYGPYKKPPKDEHFVSYFIRNLVEINYFKRLDKLGDKYYIGLELILLTAQKASFEISELIGINCHDCYSVQDDSDLG